MNDNRRQILDMLAEGKITAEEAERLIAALERGDPPPTETAMSNICACWWMPMIRWTVPPR